MTKVYDTIIIGSGMSGLTSAIYLGRAKRDVLVIEGWQAGGQLTTTTTVENFPSHNSIDGTDLVSRTRDQASEHKNVSFMSGNVKEINKISNQFVVSLDEFAPERVVYAHSVVLATGSVPKKLGIIGEAENVGQGVSYCATCDGFFYRGKDVAVIGGGDTAFEEAEFLSRFASKVTLLVRGSIAKASRHLQEKIDNLNNVEVRYSTTTVSIDQYSEGVLSLAAIVNVDGTDRVTSYKVNGAFIAIGHEPAVPKTTPELIKDQNGCVITAYNSTETNVQGLFACGDVIDPVYRQAVVASGSGAKAGIDADKFLNGLLVS